MESTFHKNKITIANNLISSFNINYDKRHNVNIVSGNAILADFFSKDHRESLFIFDSSGINNVMDFYNDISMPADIKVIDIESIKSGKDISRIIHLSKGIKFIIGVGGGRTADILKFLSFKTDISCISIPTSLTSHVYASPKIHALPAIQDFGYKLTIDGKASDLALVDTSFLEHVYLKNKRLIMAGYGDLMAFWTALEDWRLACLNKNNHYNLFAENVILDIFQKFDDININEKFSKWVDDYILIQNQLCHITDWVNSAPASGSEHLFAHEIEKYCDEPMPLHGELVSIGVLIFGYIHKLDIEKIVTLLDKFSVSRSLKQIGINKSIVCKALMDSLKYGFKKNRYTILNELNFSYADWENVIDGLIESNFILE